MKLVGIDVDGVIADLISEWLRRYNVDYNDNRTVFDLKGWGVHNYIKPECGKKVYDYLMQPDLYNDIKPIPGAVDGVNRIRALGFEVAFVTSCTYGMTDQKARWLERWGFVPLRTAEENGMPSELVVCNTKRYVDADILIDDRAETIKDWVVKKRRPAIFVEYPYNTHLDLISLDWQRVHRAPAYPVLEAAWPAIIEHMERLA